MKFYFLLLLILSLDSRAFPLKKDIIDDFVEELRVYPQLDLVDINNSLQNVNVSKKIIDLMSRPPEKTKTWTKYRKLLVSQERIDQGCKFITNNKNSLKEAKIKYGVPESIIAGIIGVETSYGKIKGNHEVLTALSTLAFHYPKGNEKRKKFFRYQLKEFLLMAHKQGMELTSYKGSYAGALGIPQFMPDNYRRLAVDFNDDGQVDIVNNSEDAIGSIGNFLRYHGWIPNDAILISLPDHERITRTGLQLNPSKVNSTLNKLVPKWRNMDALVDEKERLNFGSTLVSLLEQKEGEKIKQWLGFKNFYTLFRYNPRLFYALAVASLANELTQCEI